MPAIEITESQFQRLQRFAEPLVDTTATAFDKVLTAAEGGSGAPQPRLESEGTSESATALVFTRLTMPSLKDAVITSARIDGQPVVGHQWVDALLRMLAVVKTKAPLEEATRGTPVNVVNGKKTTGGYQWRGSLGVSVQGLSATSAGRAILELGDRFSIPVELQVRWHQSPSAAYPGQRARLTAGTNTSH